MSPQHCLEHGLHRYLITPGSAGIVRQNAPTLNGHNLLARRFTKIKKYIHHEDMH